MRFTNMTYEEFKKDWYAKLPEETQKERKSMFSMDMEEILEDFCEHDYKRYTGELKDNLEV